MIGIFVDLDGVLWFSESAHKEAFKIALDPVLSNASELVDQTWVFGESTEKYFERLLLLSNLAVTEPIIKDLTVRKRNYAAQISDIPLNEILIDSLKRLKRTEVSIALVSSSSPSNVKKFLDHANLVDFFDFIVDSTMVAAPKPDPDCYSLAMRTLKLMPHECLVIEDSDSGRMAAINAGISRVIIYPDDFPDQEFSKILITHSSDVL
jgi:beta-phosphoglucomutase-like phosphatase (HAD superfamily)